MKRVIAALLAGVVLGSAAVAGAASTWRYEGKGIHCTSSGGPGVVCIRADAKGYGVGFSRHSVVVQDGKGRAIFTRYQPSK
jgi:hypothetical protein